jgi:hypothetical protein
VCPNGQQSRRKMHQLNSWWIGGVGLSFARSCKGSHMCHKELFFLEYVQFCMSSFSLTKWLTVYYSVWHMISLLTFDVSFFLTIWCQIMTVLRNVKIGGHSFCETILSLLFSSCYCHSKYMFNIYVALSLLKVKGLVLY